MMILAVMMVMTISANAMSYNAAKHEALFLSDKMAYELNLTAAQYEAVYEINLDYLMSLNGHGDVFGIWWDRRNADLRFVLNSWQFDKYMSLAHFYRPVAWHAGGWTFAVYSHYDRGRFFNAHPKATTIVTLASMPDVTCRSPLCIILHLQCIAMHQLQLRITESPQLHTMTVTAQTVTWQ